MLCNWLSLRRLVSWINHLPLACWSTFWKSIFKQQLGCRFDIMDSISSFFIMTYASIYVLIHHIISWLYLYFLNILYFFKYSCTSIFHRRSLCTFYTYIDICDTNDKSHINVLRKYQLWFKLFQECSHYVILLWMAANLLNAFLTCISVFYHD